MNHKERILKTINHEEPDRVPIDIGGMRSTGIHAIPYRKLRKYIGFDYNSVKLYDVSQQLGLIDRDVLNYFDADVLPITRLASAFGIDIDNWKVGKLPNGVPALVPRDFNPIKESDGYKIKDKNGRTLAKRTENSLYYDKAGVNHPLENAENSEEIREGYNTQEVSQKEIEFLRSQKKKVKSSDRAVMAEFGGSLYEKGQSLRGYKQWYLDVAGNKSLVKTLLDLMVDDYLKQLDVFFDVLEDSIQIIQFGGDDLGMQDGPQISPKTYAEIFKPRHKKLFDYVHKNTDWKVFLHSCGSIYQLLPNLIEAGVDIINPVHINAANMEPERLKNEFGDEIVFWGGGCDTQETLPQGSPEEIVEEVKENIDAFAPGGGFVFTPVHNVQPDISPEKIDLLYKTAKNYGTY